MSELQIKKKSSFARAALIGGPILAVLTGLLASSAGMSQAAALTLAITLWCVTWWVFEPIPIPATSLIPLALLPLGGVLTAKELGAAYGHPLIMLLMGGFILSTALEKNGAHRRIALTMVRAFGGNSSRRLVFGFMTASAVLSMWISNTATALMLLPVALAVLEKAEDPDLPIPLLLSIAYGASVGGIGTPIGTPPNVVFMGVYAESFGNTPGSEIGFAQWMTWGVPVVLVFLPIVGLWLTRNLTYEGEISLPEVGAWQPAERRVLWVFGLTALAWVTRSEPFGGWSELMGFSYTNDAIVAFLAVVVMFLVPSGNGDGSALLDWETANKIPWGMLILFGAGISIAQGFIASGLSQTIGNTLAGLAQWPPLLMIACLCLGVTFLTESTSNTATTTLLMPILAAAAVAAAVDPKLFMIPVAMSASCAFMLPVATPPNVIVYSTNRVPIDAMVRQGFALNMIGVVIITLMCYFFFG